MFLKLMGLLPFPIYQYVKRNFLIKQDLVKYGRKMLTSALTTGSGGNISVIDRSANLVAITPSGMDYFEIEPEDIVITDLEGNIIEGRKKPSSELNFHLALYKKRKDIGSVVHTHSIYATTIASLGLELPPIHYLIACSGDKVPIAPYETFGTKKLAQTIVQYIKDYNALLLQNHGLVAVGKDIDSAFTTAEQIEFVSRVFYQASSIGKPIELSAEQMKEALKRFKTYGQK